MICFFVGLVSLTNKPVIQKARAPKTHRTVTPVIAPSQTGNRYFNAFIFNPAMMREAIMLMFASNFLFCIGSIY